MAATIRDFLPIDVVSEVLLAPPVIALIAFFSFLIIGYMIGRAIAGIMESIGVSELVEGTTFERSVRGVGSSTVAVTARLISWFIYGVGALVALHIVGVLDANLFWQEVTVFVPQLFVAILIIIIGIVVGEKVALVVAERLRGIKVPELSVIGSLAKYSIIFLAVLVALGQIGVETRALLIVLGAYAFGLVFLAGLAFKDILSSGAAGVYLLLQQPYGIGDRITVGQKTGIVQEVDLFVTRIEEDGSEYVIPNRTLFESGFVRKR